jgi:hypothetical protein
MDGIGDDVWVCAGCRSINKMRARQCYNCRTPRERAAVDPSTIDPSTSGRLRDIELPTFESPRPYAIAASALILGIAGMQVLGTVLSTRLVLTVLGGGGVSDGDLVAVGLFGLATLGVGILALAAWAAWLSKAVTAMPALGLGYPPGNGLTAFVESFVPGLNLFRVPAIVRDIVRRLSPEEGRGDAFIVVAWVGLFGGLLVPRVGRWLGFFAADTIEATIRNELVVEVIAVALVLVGAIFLVGLIWWIEERIEEARARQLGEPAAVPATAAATSASVPAGSATGRDASSMTAPLGTAEPPVAPGPLAERPLTAVAPRVDDPDRAATPPGRPTQGPHLTLRVVGGSITGALDDGPDEPLDLDEVRNAAPALARAGGSALILAGPGDAELAARLVDLLRSNGIVPESGAL